MQKRISAAENTPIRVVIVTMDSHLASAASRARDTLRAELLGLDLAIHAADEWSCNPAALEHCREDIAHGDIIVATMLFLDEHIQAVMPALAASLIAVKTASFVIPDAPLYPIPVYAISPDVYLWAVIASPFVGLWSVVFVRAIAWADRPSVRR